MLWGIAWTIFTAKSPAEHKFITVDEKKYISESIGTVASGCVNVSHSYPRVKSKRKELE